MTENFVQRFMLDDLDIRGAIVRLGSVWRQLVANRNYPAPVVDLLGRMSATTLLIADNLKQPGRLTIQLRGNGPVSLLVIDCNEALNIRGMAQHAKNIEEVVPISDIELLGRGQLMLSLDASSMQKPYQSIVPLVGNGIAEIFEHFLKQSEQLTSRFHLVAMPTGVAGLLLQKMPTTDDRDSDGWTRIEALTSTVKADELLNLPVENLLTRLFCEEAVSLFAALEVTNNCPEDWEKVGNLLRSLGRAEVYDALRERGEIVIRDDLANREYRFDKSAIDALFSNVPETPPTVH